jgi:type IX secretion system PorP/SprF family membrane protein
MKYYLFKISIFVFSIHLLNAQDPHFSQYFMSPLTINPALAGTGYGKFRLMSNFRSQWQIGGTPYSTYTLGLDANLLSNKKTKKNILGGGVLFLGDQSNFGLLKSSYVGLTIDYHQAIGKNSRIGGGFQATLGKRYLDKLNLSFGNQFGKNGFDLSSSSGENNLINMPLFYALNAGVVYSYKSTFTQFDFGFSLYNLNKPNQSFLNDKSQIYPVETVFHANYDVSLVNNIFFSGNAIFRIQSKQNYFAVGGVLGFDMTKGNNNQILYLGNWFREGDAIYPYLGLLLNNIQLGISYDITISKQNLGSVSPQSIELSFVWRDLTRQFGKIRCPWK